MRYPTTENRLPQITTQDTHYPHSQLYVILEKLYQVLDHHSKGEDPTTASVISIHTSKEHEP